MPDKRPDYFVEDTVQVDGIQVMEMIPVTDLPSNAIDSNNIIQSDEGLPAAKTTARKMSIHIGEDAMVFLNQIQNQVKIDHHPLTTTPPLLDVSKMVPTFKWKIGIWSKVKASLNMSHMYSRN